MFDEMLERIIEGGARHFVDLPVEFAFFDEVANHAELLGGLEINEFLTDGVIGMWMQFEFLGHRFWVSNDLTDYRFYVDNPDCPEAILLKVIEHFRKLI